MSMQTKILVTLALLSLVDIVIPIPFTSLLLIYIVLQKPPWFMEMAEEIYKTNQS
ncbi:MAG: hypothetical protein OEU36_02040 [Gammaproteobacteria bacterium]|nr:hypothetical protein [Gammaproteobacteria bacterium]